MKKSRTIKASSSKHAEIDAPKPMSRRAAIASTKAGKEIAHEVMKKFDEWMSNRQVDTNELGQAGA